MRTAGVQLSLFRFKSYLVLLKGKPDGQALLHVSETIFQVASS